MIDALKEGALERKMDKAENEEEVPEIKERRTRASKRVQKEAEGEETPAAATEE